MVEVIFVVSDIVSDRSPLLVPGLISLRREKKNGNEFGNLDGTPVKIVHKLVYLLRGLKQNHENQSFLLLLL